MSIQNKPTDWPYRRYKGYQEDMQTAAASWFAARDLPVIEKKPYILAKKDLWPKQIVVPEVAKLVERAKADSHKEKKAFPLHRWVHHGLSSQAMLFNLIGPLMVANDQRLLRDIFDPAGSWPAGQVKAAFEYEDRKVFKEYQGQPTSIDLIVRHQSGQVLALVECKFTENEFGGCSVFEGGDCDGRNPAADLNLCYLHFIGRRYWSRMQEYGLLDGPIGRERICLLANHYQFFRLLLFAQYYKRPFTLLFDDRNPAFIAQGEAGDRGLVPFLMTFVPEHLKTSIILLPMADVVEKIRTSGRHPWVVEFAKKYGLQESL